jgi:hypothetical protein
MEIVAPDADEVPVLFDAVTLNVYAVEGVKPVIVIEPDPD